VLIRRFRILVFCVASCIGFCACDRDDPKDTFLGVSDVKQWEVQDHSHEQMTVGEFATWCADDRNNFHKTEDIEDVRYKLSYLPAEAMAYLELRTEDYDFATFKKTLERYTDMSYFNFRIELKNGKGELLKHQLSSPGQYEDRVKYFSFKMEKDICLVQGRDTVFPGLFQFERIFEVAPYANVMFAFDNTLFNKNEEFTVVYNDVVFDKGFIKYHYQNKQLINLPNITEL